jgi:NADH:ubiquinone oxidoreductase subunit F (NADH-binding)
MLLIQNTWASTRNRLRIALRNCGLIDPENINEYLAADGYEALGKVLLEMTPEEAIKKIIDSGLAWPWWRRIPNGCQVADCQQGAW